MMDVDCGWDDENDIPSQRVGPRTMDAAAANKIEQGTLALLIEEKWITPFHSGKDWEIRGCNSKMPLRESTKKFYIACKNKIIMEARMQSSDAMTLEELATPDALSHHHIRDLSIITYKQPWAYKLTDIVVYKEPVVFTRKTGQIKWCKVDMTTLRDNSIEEGVPLRDIEESVPLPLRAVPSDLFPSAYATIGYWTSPFEMQRSELLTVICRLAKGQPNLSGHLSALQSRARDALNEELRRVQRVHQKNLGPLNSVSFGTLCQFLQQMYPSFPKDTVVAAMDAETPFKDLVLLIGQRMDEVIC